MLTLQDCIGFSGLTPDQLEAVADHEHLPMVLAAELAETVLDRPNGSYIVEHMLADEVASAYAHHDRAAAERYETCFEDFCRTHPHSCGRA